MLLEEERAEVPVEDDQVLLLARVAEVVNHLRLSGDAVAPGQEVVDHLPPLAFASVATSALVLQCLPEPAEGGDKHVLLAEKRVVEIELPLVLTSGLDKHTFVTVAAGVDAFRPPARTEGIALADVAGGRVLDVRDDVGAAVEAGG